LHRYKDYKTPSFKMAQNSNPAHIAGFLNSHDCLKKSTNLPLFYANKSKDVTKGQGLIERLEIAANIATWDDKRKVQELASVPKAAHKTGGTVWKSSR